MDDKSKLRNALFEKYFELENGISLEEVMKIIRPTVEVWKSFHKLLEENIKHFDPYSRLEMVKTIEKDNKKYLIIKSSMWKYLVIDLELQQVLINDISTIFDEKIFIDCFLEEK